MRLSLDPAARITLEIEGPFDFGTTVHKPTGWSWSTPEEVFEKGTLWTGIHVGGEAVGLKLRAKGPRVSVTAYAAGPLERDEREVLRSTLARALGEGEDIEGFYRFARKDPLLKKVTADLRGMRVGRLDELFGRVILAITLQMAPMSRSNAMMRALLELYGTTVAFDSRELTLFPTAERLAKVKESELRSKAKLGYRATRLLDAAKYLAKNPTTMADFDELTDEKAVKKIQDIPGIGIYSAGIVLGRSAPIDSWSVILMSELLLGKTPGYPRQEIEEVTRVVEERWGKWSWYGFAYILNDLENLAIEYPLTRLT